MSTRRPFAAPFGTEDPAPQPQLRPHASLAKIFAPAKLLHSALLAIALIVFAWPIALEVGLIAGAIGAAAGTELAERLISRRYRLPAILIFSAAILGAGKLALYFIADAEWFSLALSPVAAIHLAEIVRWGSAGLGASLALRATALRYRAALAIEGGVVALAVATTVAAHRDGMIARPLDVSDWFWTQGVDPVLAFLAIGVCGALLLAGVLAYGRSPKRTLAQLAFVLLLGVVLALRLHGADLENNQKRGATGEKLDDNKDQRTRAQNGGQGGQGENKGAFDQSDLPRPNDGSGHQNRPAAIVIFHKDVTPSGGVFYFRHAAFSQFNGNRLVESTRSDADIDAVRSFPTVRQEVKGTIKDAPGRELVATDVVLITDHSRMFALTDPTEVSPLPNPEPARFRRAYHVVASVVSDGYEELIGSAPGDPEWSDELWRHYTEVPKDERYHKLSAELRGQLKSDYADDPIAMALTVKQYLESTATYSFKRNYEGEQDPTAAFLFSEDKRGYCVHLAHAAAYLLRAAGVPARVSAGYGVPAQNLGGGSALLIKSGDAHAWAEIYLENIGWVPIEVTPEKTDVKPQMFAEKDLQQLLGEMARKEGREQRDAYQGPKLMDAIKAFLALLPKIALVLLAVAYLIKLWRLIAPWMAGSRNQSRLAYRAALDRLSAIGSVRTRGEPRERFARRVRMLAPSFVPLTATHVGVALGSPVVLKEVQSVAPPPLTSLSSKVGSELRKGVPWWRWVIGVLNPINWIWSR